MEHLTVGFLHNEHRAPSRAPPGALARQGSAHGSDPPVILSEAAGRGQGLIGAPETVRSGSPISGTADGAAQIEFFEFDPLLIAWQLNDARELELKTPTAIGRVGARSPGPCPSLSVTLVISITSRPTFDPAPSDMLQLTLDMRHDRTSPETPG